MTETVKGKNRIEFSGVIMCVRFETIRKWAFQMICSCSFSLILPPVLLSNQWFDNIYTSRLHLSRFADRNAIASKEKSLCLLFSSLHSFRGKQTNKNKWQQRRQPSNWVYFSISVRFPINRLNEIVQHPKLEIVEFHVDGRRVFTE